MKPCNLCLVKVHPDCPFCEGAGFVSDPMYNTLNAEIVISNDADLFALHQALVDREVKSQ